jgi:hypothetical protein
MLDLVHRAFHGPGRPHLRDGCFHGVANLENPVRHASKAREAARLGVGQLVPETIVIPRPKERPETLDERVGIGEFGIGIQHLPQGGQSLRIELVGRPEE